jgi:hypothetical protein
MDNKISRRRAAKLFGATAAGTFLPIGASRLFAAGESSQRIMRAIPSTHEKLPAIGLGSALTTLTNDITGDDVNRVAREFNLGPREQALFRVDVADVIAPDEPLCEVCRGRARRENGATARGARR